MYLFNKLFTHYDLFGDQERHLIGIFPMEKKDRQHAKVNIYEMGKIIEFKCHTMTGDANIKTDTHKRVNTYVVDASPEYGQNK